eukprot:4705781-Pyramimonas_sp.AAC.2
MRYQSHCAPMLPPSTSLKHVPAADAAQVDGHVATLCSLPSRSMMSPWPPMAFGGIGATIQISCRDRSPKRTLASQRASSTSNAVTKMLKARRAETIDAAGRSRRKGSRGAANRTWSGHLQRRTAGHPCQRRP